MVVQNILERSARAWPDKPAVWFNNTWKTYGELNSDADALAAFLIELGIQRGDRVALLLENSFDYITAHFAAFKAGAVEVSLNTDLMAESLRQLLLHCDAKVLITAHHFLRHWKHIANALPGLNLVLVDHPPEALLPNQAHVHFLRDIPRVERASWFAPKVKDLDLASIIYTSGSTGEPKGVMLSHRNLISNAQSIVEYLGLREEDRMLVVLPFYYVYGRSLLYTHFLTGGSLAIDNRFAFTAAILDTMQKLKVTCFAGVPSTFAILLFKGSFTKDRFPHLRLVTQAGGGMAPTLQQEVVAAFHPARVFVMYGCTEASPRLTYVEPEMLPKKWGSIGKAIPNVEIMVVDACGTRLPSGVQGEIAARGSNIMMGYWKSPEATAEVLKNDYYYTGDLGFEDEDGYLFLTGRARDIIKVGGNRVSSKEIEDAILELPGTLEAAVIGVADEILGEAIKAFVVPRVPTLTAEQVAIHLRQRLPLFKQPKVLEFREGLPKNPAGKILKSILRKEQEELHRKNGANHAVSNISR